MPLNDRFYNPGAAATSALFELLADREAKQRQARLAITRQTAAREDEVTRASLELQREQMTGLREQREAAADISRQKKALGVIGTLEPGAAVDAPTADIIRQGGFSPLLQSPGVVAAMPREADADLAGEVDSAPLEPTPRPSAPRPTRPSPTTTHVNLPDALDNLSAGTVANPHLTDLRREPDGDVAMQHKVSSAIPELYCVRLHLERSGQHRLDAITQRASSDRVSPNHQRRRGSRCLGRPECGNTDDQ